MAVPGEKITESKPSYIAEIAARIRNAAGDADGDNLMYLIYAVLVLAKGEAVTAADVHNAWAAATEYLRTTEGDHQANEDLVPFDELSESVRTRDAAFVAAIQIILDQGYR